MLHEDIKLYTVYSDGTTHKTKEETENLPTFLIYLDK